MRSYSHHHYKTWLIGLGAVILLLAGLAMVWTAAGSSADKDARNAADSETAGPGEKSDNELPGTDKQDTEPSEPTKNQKSKKKHTENGGHAQGRSAESAQSEGGDDPSGDQPVPDDKSTAGKSDGTTEKDSDTVSSSKETGDAPSEPTEPSEPSMSPDTRSKNQHDPDAQSENADEEDDFLSGDPAGENGIGGENMPEFHVPNR